MKASELIMELEQQIAEYGDLEVRYDHYNDPDATPLLVVTYGEDDNCADEDNPASHIFIHQAAKSGLLFVDSWVES